MNRSLTYGIVALQKQQPSKPSCVSGWLLALSCAIYGCSGPSQVDPKLVMKNLDLLQQAKNKADSGDFSSAVSILDECVNSCVLPLDALGTAIALRAKCYIKIGDLERAKMDVDNLDQVVDDLTLVYGLQYLYWKKKGDNFKAQNAWREALKINPSFKPPQ